MPEQSTTNLITATNRVLENIGERKVLSINTPVARKVVEAFKDSLADIASLNDWEWLKEWKTTASWSNERADIGDVSRTHTVQWGDSTVGFRNLQFVDARVFDYKPLLSYSVGSTKPNEWTLETYNIVRFNPYPVTAEEQARIRFYVSSEMVSPNDPTDLFPLPEKHMTMLYYRTQAMLAQTHLDDGQLAAQWEGQFQAYVQRIRDRERLQPSYGGSAFRLRSLYGNR